MADGRVELDFGCRILGDSGERLRGAVPDADDSSAARPSWRRSDLRADSRAAACKFGGKRARLVLESVAASGATTLADFYTARLYDFFHRPRGSRYFLRPTTSLRRSLMHELQNFRRYLSDHEQAACERLFALVRRKDDLDFHEARQKLLKTWLFVHIGLTYGLVVLALLHGLLALAFRGGAA